MTIMITDATIAMIIRMMTKQAIMCILGVTCCSMSLKVVCQRVCIRHIKQRR